MPSDPPDPLAMSAEAMRRLGYDVIDRLVDRIAGLDGRRTWGGARRAEIEPSLAAPPPVGPDDPARLLDILERDVLRYAGSVDHPRFFAFVPGAPTWPGIMGDLLAAGYNVFNGTWLESAGPSQLELVVLDWFRQWLDMPEATQGLLTSGGSAANLGGVVCAREARLGEATADAVLYHSGQTHSAVPRAARIAGFRRDQIRALAVDHAYRLPVEGLRAAIREDLDAGRRPFLVAATAGATSTGAVDPLDDIADLCAEHDLWLHVDAAYGGFAVLTDRGRALMRGLGRAHSVVLDPHKWLYQPFEVGCLLVSEPDALRRAFRVMPDYMQDTAVRTGEVNFSDRGLQLTRSARALKVWLSLRTFGVEAFTAAIDRSLDLAEYAAERIRAEPRFELLTGPALGVVCFRRVDAGERAGADREAELERLNAVAVEKLSASGIGMTSSTRVNGVYALRLCILSHHSKASDVDRVLDFLASVEG